MTKRAVGDGDKEARKRDILELAAKLLAQRPFETIRMADIASELGLAKGTLYLYFNSKESLFLSLLSERLDACLGAIFAEVGPGLPGHDEGTTAQGTATRLSAAIASALAADPILPRLMALAHPVLERKVTWDEAVAWKRGLASFLEGAGAELGRRLPGLGEKGGERFFLHLWAAVVGLVQITDISPFMARMGAEAGLGIFRLGFKDMLAESAGILLEGLPAPPHAQDPTSTG
jgi:AcrR family transcriptional regulator